MKKFLLALTACVAASGLSYAGTRTMEVSVESLGISSLPNSATKAYKTQDQDGITVAYYGQYYSSKDSFYIRGNCMDETVTTLPGFFAIVENVNGYKITSVSFTPTASSSLANYQLNTSATAPTIDTTSKSNYITPSQWTPDVSGKGFTDGSDSKLDLTTPSPYVLISNLGSTLWYFGKVTFTYEVEGDDRQASKIAFEQSNLEIATVETDVELKLNTNLSADMITWTVSPDNGGLLCDNGKLTPVTVGTYTVTASFEGNEQYTPASAMATVKVVTKSEPFFQFSQESIQLDLGVTKNMGQLIERDSDITGYTFDFEPIGNSPADGVDLTASYLKTIKDGEYWVSATYPGSDVYLPKVAKIKVISGQGLATGVEAIDAEAANAEYFTLQGVRVDANSLGAGIYLKRNGEKVTKIVRK